MKHLPLLLCCVFCAPSTADKPLRLLNEGDLAPKFQALDDQGQTWKSADYVGQSVVVVYFYPADMSGMCTQQARAFQERLDDLKKAAVTVVGVSGDSVKNHQLFKKTNSLNFPLLADEDGKVARAFGVPVRDGGKMTRVVEGKPKLLVRGVTAQRWTFVIGMDGKILDKNTEVNAEADCLSVLKVVGQLTASTQ
jgi:peroxiredoxin Q/BCP